MSTKDTRKRIQVRLDDETLASLHYWAKRDEVSINEWIEDAIATAIAIKNGDFKNTGIMEIRINQLIDMITAMDINVGNLSRIVVHGFESLAGVSDGRNYLKEDDDTFYDLG